MCGRFIQVSNPEKIKVMISDLEISSEVRSNFVPRYNIVPTQNILTVLNLPVPELVYTRWGLIPFWAKDPKMGQKMINARAETIAEKSSFRTSFRKKRCIIVSDGFYEWKSANKGKTPFLVRLKSQDAFGIAGLWDQWTDPDTGGSIISSTIITTTPNDLLSAIHNRMPAILRSKDYHTWLRPEETRDDVIRECIISYPSEEMEAFEVSRLVNNPSYDSQDCIAPLWS